MTQRVVGSQLRLLNRRDAITADWLNKVAAQAEKNARALEQITTEQPEGEDGDGTAASVIWNETSRITSTVRIEDASDPTIYVEVTRIDSVTFAGSGGEVMTMNFNNT